MIKNQTYKKIIEKQSYLKVIQDLGIENMELSKETIIYYEPKNNRFSYQDFQYQWLELIINKFKEGSSAKLKYIHTYPENEMYFSRKEEYVIDILQVDNFQKIMEKLDFVIAYKDKKKTLQTTLEDKYMLTLYNTNENIYEIEIKTIDSHYITKDEFEEINSFFIKYDISPDEEF